MTFCYGSRCCTTIPRSVSTIEFLETSGQPMMQRKVDLLRALAAYFLRDMPEEPQLVSIDRVENQQAWSQYQKTSTCGFRMSIGIR